MYNTCIGHVTLSCLARKRLNCIGVGAGGARGAIVPPLFKVGGLEYLLAPPHFLADKNVFGLSALSICPNLASWETESAKFLAPPARIQSDFYRF